MRILKYQKKTLDGEALKRQLLDADFKVLGVGCRFMSAPETYVYLDDSESKDPTPIVQAYVDPDVLSVTSSGDAPADGQSKCKVTIQKKDPYTGQDKPGTEKLQIVPSQMIGVTPYPVYLVNGKAVVEIGPSSMPGELSVSVSDVEKKLTPGRIRILFT
jgi:hypothetical protein